MVRRVRDAWWFAGVLLALSVPFYAIGPLLGSLSSVTAADVPASALMVVVPAVVTLVLRGRAGGGDRPPERGRRDRQLLAWLSTAFVMPVIVVITVSLSPPDDAGWARPDAGALLLLLVTYAVGALLEEIGWTGYLLPRLLDQFGEHVAGLLVGVLWAVWHLVPYIQSGYSAGEVAGWCLFTVVFRVLLVRFAVAAGPGAVWAAALGHMASNVAWSLSPGDGALLDVWTLTGLTTVAALIAWAMVNRAREPASEQAAAEERSPGSRRPFGPA